MDTYKQKMIANHMEPIFKKMKIGDRGIFDVDGHEYFVAKHMPKVSVGAYRDRKYILPIEYINDIKTGIDREAGCQITAGYFGSHFTYAPSDCKRKSHSLDFQIADARNEQTKNIKKDLKQKDKGINL